MSTKTCKQTKQYIIWCKAPADVGLLKVSVLNTKISSASGASRLAGCSGILIVVMRHVSVVIISFCTFFVLGLRRYLMWHTQRTPKKHISSLSRKPICSESEKKRPLAYLPTKMYRIPIDNNVDIGRPNAAT